jgi:hypothetical protein
VFFDNDNKILYSQFEISATEIIQQFKYIIDAFEDLPNKRPIYNSKTLEMDAYIKSQLDFEVHFGIHNHKKNLFNYVNTKLFPTQPDSKTGQFYVEINEKFSSANSVFILDDGQGISEMLPDFYSMDFILKDRDDVLISYSGFVQTTKLDRQAIAKKVKNYFELGSEDYDIYTLLYTGEGYTFEIIYFHNPKYKEIIVYSLTCTLTTNLLRSVFLK